MSGFVTAILERFDRQEGCTVQRHEVFSRHFSDFRRSLRVAITGLVEMDDEDGGELASLLRSRLFKLLTVPVEFNQELIPELDGLGSAGSGEARWGREISQALEAARVSARLMSEVGSPMRLQLGKILTDLGNSGANYRIYCHRTARPEFESLVGFPAPGGREESIFLHSTSNFQQMGPFDALVKVGPLRSSGWGSVPDAVISAPRFDSLIQVVWSGCRDEPGFGYDPAVVVSAKSNGAGAGPARRDNRVRWTTSVFPCGDEVVDTAGNGRDEDVDELQAFAERGGTERTSRGVLLQLDHTRGVLFPPHSWVLSFDPSATSLDPIALRMAGEGLGDGMFIIYPYLGGAGSNDLHAEEGNHTRRWKNLLDEAFRRDPDGLVRKLRARGIALKGLKNSIERWCGPATSVIRAPKKRRHFEILIEILEMDFPDGGPRLVRGVPWWKLAWEEIVNSRGDAIQTGMQEHGETEEACREILEGMILQLRAKVDDGVSAFTLTIPKGNELQGAFLFYRIHAVEEGFEAPPSYFREITELEELDQWRE